MLHCGRPLILTDGRTFAINCNKLNHIKHSNGNSKSLLLLVLFMFLFLLFQRFLPPLVLVAGTAPAAGAAAVPLSLMVVLRLSSLSSARHGDQHALLQ